MHLWHLYNFVLFIYNKQPSKNLRDVPQKETHCKKRLPVFPSPAGMSLTKLSLAGINLIIPVQGEFGKWHTSSGGKTANLFYIAEKSGASRKIDNSAYHICRPQRSMWLCTSRYRHDTGNNTVIPDLLTKVRDRWEKYTEIICLEFSIEQISTEDRLVKPKQIS